MTPFAPVCALLLQSFLLEVIKEQRSSTTSSSSCDDEPCLVPLLRAPLQGAGGSWSAAEADEVRA
jgi:hypothetical protein